MTDFVSKSAYVFNYRIINFYNNSDRKMKKGRLKIWFQTAFCFKGMYLRETQTFIGSGKHKNKQRG